VLAILSFLRAGRAEERAKNAEHRAERAERREEERHARDDQRFEREHRDERVAALERVAEHLREVQAAFDAGIGGDVTAISRGRSARTRLGEAVKAAPVDLPICRALAAGEPGYVDPAEAEAEEAIANERLLGDRARARD
jgi:hypothetical protein